MERHSSGLARAVIVGGGLIGVEMAEMFHSRGIPVTFLVRESAFWSSVLPVEEAQMVTRHLREYGIDLRHEEELQAIEPDTGGQKCAAILTKGGERIPCGFVGLTAGVRPNIDFLKNTSLSTGRGILVDPFLKTNMPDVWAIGDCAELKQPLPGRKTIEAVWYTGRMMGETAAFNLLAAPGREKAYDPGTWFNSAKFFDIEYQVYGQVPAQIPDSLDTLYWEHPGGKKSIRIVFEKANGAVKGFNLMGIRYRQEVCEKWIQTQSSVEEVLTNLGLANFDPEFSGQYEQEVLRVYQGKTGKTIPLQQKRGLPGVLRFLGSRTVTKTVHSNDNPA
jgi:NADPH-dependent 2,4-dienoyl-CoA reductase/sulfur reductase-like enzyme